MPSPLRRRARLLLVSLAGLISLAAGTVLVFRLMRVDTLDTLPTQVLLAVLGLLVLPVLSAWAFWLQRSLALRGHIEPREFQPVPQMFEVAALPPVVEATAEPAAEVPGRHAETVPGRRPARGVRSKARIHEPAPEQRRP